MRKRFTAADRPEFRRQVGELLSKTGAEVGELTSDVSIICSKAKDFDPADNVLWELKANKSAARPDVLCVRCKAPLAMSNHNYSRWSSLDQKPKTYCVECALGVVSKP